MQRDRRALRQTIGKRALLTWSGLLAWFVGCATLSVAGEMEFTRHEIGPAGNKMGQTFLVDVDGDGDIDICSKPWNGDLHVYLENVSQ